MAGNESTAAESTLARAFAVSINLFAIAALCACLYSSSRHWEYPDTRIFETRFETAQLERFDLKPMREIAQSGLHLRRIAIDDFYLTYPVISISKSQEVRPTITITYQGKARTSQLAESEWQSLLKLESRAFAKDDLIAIAKQFDEVQPCYHALHFRIEASDGLTIRRKQVDYCVRKAQESAAVYGELMVDMARRHFRECGQVKGIEAIRNCAAGLENAPSAFR